MNILVIGDDVKSVNILSFILRQEGYDVYSIVDRSQTDRVGSDYLADLVLLDEDTVEDELLHRIESIRGASSVPVLLLCQPTSERDIIYAYEYGIDDYLLKPYSYQMLLAHVNAQLRRARVVPSALVPNLLVGNINLDPERHTVTLSGGQSRQLTNLEFRLLYCLVTNRGHVLSTETIIEKVWGYTGEGDRNLLKSLISRLRSKVEVSPREPRLIQTVPGVGYTFSPAETLN